MNLRDRIHADAQAIRENRPTSGRYSKSDDEIAADYRIAMLVAEGGAK